MKVAKGKNRDFKPKHKDSKKRDFIDNKSKLKRLKKHKWKPDNKNKKEDVNKKTTAEKMNENLSKEKTVVKQIPKSADSKMNPKEGSGKKDQKLSVKPVVNFPKGGAVSENWKLMKEKICGESSTKKRQKDFPTKKESSHKKHRGKLTNLKEKTRPTEESIQSAQIWFDGVDPSLLDTDASKQNPPAGKPSVIDPADKLVKQNSFQGVTRTVAMDCEMVGVGDSGQDSILARVSIVNNFGNCIYDKFVKPREKVTDYRTHVSGVRATYLKTAEEFSVVQKEVADVLDNRILVGHALQNDLQVLYLTHPRGMTRDTQSYKPFRAMFNGKRPSLKKLTDKVLGVQVQTGEHSSIQDAQAAMRLYTMYKKDWEKTMKEHKPVRLKGMKRKRKTAKKHQMSVLNIDT